MCRSPYATQSTRAFHLRTDRKEGQSGPRGDTLRIVPMATAHADRLDSWKEIAAYLNRSVRTVRRWERDEGLPVHRHMHQTLGSVYAEKSELDAWRDALSRAPAMPDVTKSIAVLPFENLSTDPENEY